jgi:hypothetical protein
MAIPVVIYQNQTQNQQVYDQKLSIASFLSTVIS